MRENCVQLLGEIRHRKDLGMRQEKVSLSKDCCCVQTLPFTRLEDLVSPFMRLVDVDGISCQNVTIHEIGRSGWDKLSPFMRLMDVGGAGCHHS